MTAKQPPMLYDLTKIARRVDDERRHRGWTVEEACEIIECGKSAWYKKADGTNPFSLREIGLFAARAGMPEGWPFIEESAARFLQRELGRPGTK